MVYDKSHFSVPKDQWVKWRHVHRGRDCDLDETIGSTETAGENEIKLRFLRF